MIVRTMRLACSGFWADVRLTQLRGRWVASADTPDGPSLGLGSPSMRWKTRSSPSMASWTS